MNSGIQWEIPGCHRDQSRRQLLPFSESGGPMENWGLCCPAKTDFHEAAAIHRHPLGLVFFYNCGNAGSGTVVVAGLVADVGNIMPCWQPERK